MPLPVLNMLDQRVWLIQIVTDQLHNIDIGHFIMAADIVGLAITGLPDDEVDSLAVILDIEPVSDILTLAIYRQRLVSKRIRYHQRDQLLRELVGAIIIRTAAYSDRKSVGPVICHHEQICRGLRGRIRA